MAEMNDYSGEFKPDLRWEDFSKDFLISLIRETAGAYTRIDEIWYSKVAPLLGEEKAFDLELAVWDRVAEVTVPKFARLGGVEVKDIVDVLKVWQLCPDGTLAGVFDAEYEIRDRDHVIFTITRCRILELFERKMPERIVPVCQKAEQAGMESYFRTFIPDVVVTPLKLPPRKSPDEIPCKWEFRRGARA